MEYEQLYENYSKLGLDDKRDAYNQELLKVYFLIKEYLTKQNIVFEEKFFNYQKGIDKELSESELLDENFKNIYNIKRELILLLNLMNLKE